MEIPGYTLKNMLGKGGMASVYLAVQDKFERDVALKIMAPALSADPSFRERFLREAKIVAKISHPHIVAVYDVNEVNDIYYIAMEFHPGGDLKARIRQGLSVRDSVSILRDTAKALDYAHSKGYLHRDIKPDNILFRADGSAVLTDFGIAKATAGDSNLTQMGLVAGTPKYMSPEQARGQALQPDSDIYSLGVMFFEMLTGHLPFEATDPIALGIMHLNSPIPKLEGRLAHFQPLVDRMMAKHSAERPQRGLEVVQAIDALASSFDFDAVDTDVSGDQATEFRPRMQPAKPSTGEETLVTPTLRPSPRAQAQARAQAEAKKKSPLPLVIGAVVVLAGVGGGYAFLSKSHQEAPQAVPGVVSLQPLLDAGAAALARGDLVTPAGQSAADDFRAVLAQDPTNVQAQTGLQQVVTNLQQQGMTAVHQHDMTMANTRLDQLRKLAPNDLAVVDLEKAVTAATPAPAPAAEAAPAAEPAAPEEKHAAAAKPRKTEHVASSAGNDLLVRLKVSGLMQNADSALAGGDAAGAIAGYQQVLSLDPGNAEARAGLRKAKAAAH